MDNDPKKGLREPLQALQPPHGAVAVRGRGATGASPRAWRARSASARSSGRSRPPCDHRPRPRARAALEPADPGVAVRLGGGRGARASRSSRSRCCGRSRGSRTRAGGRCRAASGASLGSRAVEVACGAIGVAAARARASSRATPGRDTPLDNFAPTFVFIIFWVGLVFVERAVRRRLPRLQPVAGARARAVSRGREPRARTRSGSAAGPPPSGCSRSPGSSSPRAGARSPPRSPPRSPSTRC